jgi:hypothetical protein
MDYDKDKVDDVTLALLYLVMSTDEYGSHRAWEGFDWDTMDRLYEKGLIDDPKSKARSVSVSEEGAERAKALFLKYFGTSTKIE